MVQMWTFIHFSSMSHFYTPWKRQKTIGFLTFSGGIEMWHWTKLGKSSENNCRPTKRRHSSAFYWYWHLWIAYCSQKLTNWDSFFGWKTEYILKWMWKLLKDSPAWKKVCEKVTKNEQLKFGTITRSLFNICCHYLSQSSQRTARVVMVMSVWFRTLFYVQN